MIETIYAKQGEVSIIDIGGTEAYWNIVPPGFLDANNVHITLVNLPGTGDMVSHGRFSIVKADGCDLGQFADFFFDIAHSNSVIEHVGDRSRMIAFADEIRRVAPVLYVQTPYYWFPIEPHAMMPFFQWLPQKTRVWLITHFALGHLPKGNSKSDAQAIVDGTHLLRRGELRALFPLAKIKTEWFFGLPKSLTAIGASTDYRTSRSV
jgi:hypothetical protein